MNMGFLESLLYALVSGVTEFLPVSSQAHGAILRRIFGVTGQIPLLDLFVHIGVLLAVYFGTSSYIMRLSKEHNRKRLPRNRRRRNPDFQAMADMALCRSALIPLLLGFLLYPIASSFHSRLNYVAIFLLLNGIILIVPSYLPRGNKDSRNMTRFDGVLMGIAGALAVFPGISRVGAISSFAVARGADPKQALRWNLLLSIPVLAAWIVLDIYLLIATGFAGVNFLAILIAIVSAAVACGGASLAIVLVRFVCEQIGFSNFSYYAWGAALFSFVLYMTI